MMIQLNYLLIKNNIMKDMKYIKTSVKFLTTSTTFTSSFDKKIRNINRNETPCSNVNTATYQRNSTCKGIVKIHTLQITTIKQNLYTFTTLPVSAQLRYQTNRDSCNRSKRTNNDSPRSLVFHHVQSSR